MFLLLALGIATALIADPAMLVPLRQGIGFHLPRLTLMPMPWPDLAKGLPFLAIPQIPLTLGNGVIAIVAENNALFPGRKVALSTGVMNLIMTVVGNIWRQ